MMVPPRSSRAALILAAGLALWCCSASGVSVGPGFSGAWFDPGQDGQGWIVEVLPDGRAVVYWFTYPPEGQPGTSAWVQGSGRVEGDSIVIEDTVISRGARFGAAFDPADLEAGSWGSWTMTFEDCDSGSLTYDGPPAFGSGEYQLARLSRIQGTACGGGDHDPAATGFSGSWYDPATDGQGVTLGVLPDGRVLIYWFTFDPDGNQQWLLGVGQSHGDRVEFPEVHAFAGTAFGNGFDPGAVTATDWGSLSLTFDTCGRGTLNYRGPDETWGAGSMQVRRLTRLAGHPCNLGDRAPLNQGTWGAPIPMTTGTSEVAVATHGGFAYVAGDLTLYPYSFQRFDPQNHSFETLRGLPSPRNHAVLAAVGDSLYLMGGRNSNKDIYRYIVARDRWRRIGNFPVPFGHTSGTGFGEHVYVVTEEGDVRRFRAPGPGMGTLGSRNGVLRDHAQTVVFRRELWWMGGRTPNDQNLSSVEIFDPVTRVWRVGPSMNDTRSGFAAAVVQGQIMVAGGEDFSGAPVLVPSMEVYAPGHGWRRGPAMPTPLHGVGGASLEGRFYALGGSPNAGGGGSANVSQVYIPAR